MKSKIWRIYLQVFRNNTQLFKKLGPHIKKLLKQINKIN